MSQNVAAMPGPSAIKPEISQFHTEYARQKQEKTRLNYIYGGAFIVLFFISAYIGNFDPVTIINGIPRLHEYIEKTIPVLRWDHLWHDLNEWFFLINVWMELLLETILIAFLASVMAICGAVLLCFPASKNLTQNSTIYFITRRILEIFRTVPELVYALIFVFCFGVGPMAGVLAIAVHSTGALGKLFSEVNENVDTKAIEGLRASGASWFQTIRYAVVPQVLPNFTSYALLRFEINVRSSSIVGYVGAGGLGQEIRTAVGFGEYYDLSAIFLIIFTTVAIIDLTCERIRHHFIGKESV
jgi:phosphonate transport system permease protein